MTFDPKWPNKLITFQEIDLHPSKVWSNSQVLFTSDEVCSLSENMISSLIGEMFKGAL